MRHLTGKCERLGAATPCQFHAMFSVLSRLIPVMKTIIDSLPEIRKTLHAKIDSRCLGFAVKHNRAIVHEEIHVASHPFSIRFAYISITTSSDLLKEPFTIFTVWILIRLQKRIASILFVEFGGWTEIVHVFQDMRMRDVYNDAPLAISRQILRSWALANHPF